MHESIPPSGLLRIGGCANNDSNLAPRNRVADTPCSWMLMPWTKQSADGRHLKRLSGISGDYAIVSSSHAIVEIVNDPLYQILPATEFAKVIESSEKLELLHEPFKQ
jgi:hypothetical protein